LFFLAPFSLPIFRGVYATVLFIPSIEKTYQWHFLGSTENTSSNFSIKTLLQRNQIFDVYSNLMFFPNIMKPGLIEVISIGRKISDEVTKAY
jgi:hypothetical protein